MIHLLLATMLVADVTPPDIVHEPLKSAPRLQELVIQADIVDDVEIFEPTLQLRLIGDSKYQTFRMETKDKLTFTATIPGSKIDRDFEYYLEAFDTNGNGPARSGSPSRPHRVGVVDSLPPPAIVDAIPAPQPAAGTTPQASLPPAAVAPAPEGAPFPVGPVATLGAGLAAVGVGAALWFAAAGQVSEIDQRYAPGVGRLPQDAAATQAARFQSVVASAVAIGGGVVAAGGVAWFLVPAPGGGGSAGVSASF